MRSDSNERIARQEEKCKAAYVAQCQKLQEVRCRMGELEEQISNVKYKMFCLTLLLSFATCGCVAWRLVYK